MTVNREFLALEQRLNTGWDTINKTIAQGNNPKAFEEHWLMLLDQYKEAYDAAMKESITGE